MSERVFRFLEPVTKQTPINAPRIELCGGNWVLNEYSKIPEELAYTCVSYLWGLERIENPLNSDQLISSRTFPALEATIRASQARENWSGVPFSADKKKAEAAIDKALKATGAFWIDALCVPAEGVARTLALRSMGEIYHSAHQVFVALDASNSNVFRQIDETGRLDPDALFTLESDKWITRAWTYQEVVNSRAIYFIVQGDQSDIVSGTDFLHAVLTGSDDYKRAHGLNTLVWGEQYPNLESLKCVIAEYKIADYAERSAYQVMSAMHARFAEKPDDLSYAMVGAITTSSSAISDELSCSPSEFFMQTCEAKGDYSFIYNVAPRNETYGKRWRPIEGAFAPVLPELIIFGKGQSGNLTPTHLELENMCRLKPKRVGPGGMKAAIAHLAMAHKDKPKNRTYSSPNEVAEALLELLRARGFSGCGEYMELEYGFFFTQSRPNRSREFSVALPIEVHWQGGRPGLLLHRNDTAHDSFGDVGAFIGQRPKNGQSITLD